jgi:hypothetical protein
LIESDEDAPLAAPVPLSNAVVNKGLRKVLHNIRLAAVGGEAASSTLVPPPPTPTLPPQGNVVGHLLG